MSNTHGGKREGAGRKPTGRKRQFIYVTGEELAKIKELLDKLRATDAEWETLKQEAIKVGTNRSEYIRRKALN